MGVNKRKPGIQKKKHQIFLNNFHYFTRIIVGIVAQICLVECMEAMKSEPWYSTQAIFQSELAMPEKIVPRVKSLQLLALVMLLKLKLWRLMANRLILPIFRIRNTISTLWHYIIPRKEWMFQPTLKME